MNPHSGAAPVALLASLQEVPLLLPLRITEALMEEQAAVTTDGVQSAAWVATAVAVAVGK